MLTLPLKGSETSTGDENFLFPFHESCQGLVRPPKEGNFRIFLRMAGGTKNINEANVQSVRNVI